MDAKFWTFEKLVTLPAKDLEQLIENLKRFKQTSSQKRGAPTHVASINAAVNRAKFVLYACGNLLPTHLADVQNDAEWKGFNPSQSPRTKSILSNTQLLAIVNLQRILCASKPSAQQQAVLKLLGDPQSHLFIKANVMSEDANAVSAANAQSVRLAA